MTDILQPFRELIGKWHEVESLIPSLEKAIADLERENHKLKLNLVEPTIQLRIDREVAKARLAHTIEARRVFFCPGGRENFLNWLDKQIAANRKAAGGNSNAKD